MSPVSIWLLTGYSLSLQNSSNPDKSYSSEIIKVHRVRTKSWILTKVLNFIQLFSRPGKSEENRWSLEKMKKSLEFFSKLQQVLYKWFFFLFLLFFFFKSFSTSPVCLQSTMKKALFLHLFDKTLSMEKEIFVLQKGLENVFNLGSKNCANPELLSTATSMSEIIYV